MTQIESTKVVSIGELETVLRRAGWLAWVIDVLLAPPVPHEVNCGAIRYIVKR